jgi:hypothetical protein
VLLLRHVPHVSFAGSSAVCVGATGGGAMIHTKTAGATGTRRGPASANRRPLPLQSREVQVPEGHRAVVRFHEPTRTSATSAIPAAQAS